MYNDCPTLCDESVTIIAWNDVKIIYVGGRTLGLGDRSTKILNELISNPSITSASIEKKYNLTKRQLGYSIKKINEWLELNDLPIIERTRQGRFVINQAIFTELATNENIMPVSDPNILTEEQRVYLILLMLLSSKEELSLNHFTIDLDVSKNTILSDLKQAQELINNYHLDIRYSRKHGYLIEGKEFQIRKLLIYITYQVLQMSNGETRFKEIAFLHSREIEEFTNRIIKVENELSLRFTDEKLKTMPLILLLILRRVEQGYVIETFPIEYEELSNTKEYQATEELLYGYKNIEKSERVFITLHLLTASIFSSNLVMEETIPNLFPAIDNMLRQFEKSACIYLKDRDQLLDKLFQHIKPAYYRIKYHLTDSIVHMQGKLSSQFKELHHLVKRSIGPLEDLIGETIPDNEIAFITMLIGGWMNRQGESIDKKVKAIVVCPQGVSVSRILFNELRELFPEFVFLDFLSVREYLHYPLDFDVVFSPIYIETEKKLFVTKTFLGQEERNRLRNQVMLEIHGYVPNDIDINQVVEIISNHAAIRNEKELARALEGYFKRDDNSAIIKQVQESDELNLNEMITPDRIILRNTVSSWEDAVRIAANPLVKNGNIDKSYVETMIQYSLQDSYIIIGPGMAIPHAAPDDGVHKVGMSLLRVRDGVDYLQTNRIQLIIIIAAEDKQQHLRALMQLMNLSGSDEDRNEVINAKSTDEVYEILSSYSDE